MTYRPEQISDIVNRPNREIWVRSGSAQDLQDCINSYASERTIRIPKGNYVGNFTVPAPKCDDIQLIGSGWQTVLQAQKDAEAVLELGTDGNTLYRAYIANMQLQAPSGRTQITGLLQNRMLYGIIENIYIVGSSSVDRLQTGWKVKQNASAGAHSLDNFVKHMRILNFYENGIVFEDVEDTEICGVNVGTQNAGANACFLWDSPNANLDSGGSGLNVANFHFWGVAGNTAYGMYFGSANNGNFRSRWSNVWGGDTAVGVRFNGANSHDHMLNNVIVGTCSTERLQDAGTRNSIRNYKPAQGDAGSWFHGVFTAYAA